MRLYYLLAAAVAVAAGPAKTKNKHKWRPGDTSGTDLLADIALDNLASALPEPGYTNNTCSLETAAKRREWHTLSKKQKKSYIAAVKCLQSKPAQNTAIPGARNRYDDFVGVHIQQTLSIHGTGNFLSWHRWFTYAYEQALRTECGYKGYQPYLNWGKVAQDPRRAPIFDGSDTSMSGDGAFRNYSGIATPSDQQPFIRFPNGKGGDCIYSGPFKDYKVNLGPLAPKLPFAPPNPSPDGLGYNPRCIRRDISFNASRTALNDANTTSLIKDNNNILAFQNAMQGDFPAGLVGVHTAGHYLVGGDPGGDLFASPGDPYFFLHHSQIDRVWWIWQNQDIAARERAIAGTLTLFNSPPSRDTSLNDTIELPGLAETRRIGDLMSTTKAGLCYVYV
ncbi:Tyrosinase-like protein 1 [Elsinoe fawcettii]|nr:Tyrosinase-like protein 1 [Elsinoe fawcettii]